MQRGWKTCLWFTSDNKLYGFGYEKLLNRAITDDSIQEKVSEINLEIEGTKIVDICGGNGWYVVTTSDGRVFGTGANNYGILGRWKGVSRGTSNSRYKTAFELVECPELEI